MNSLDVPDLREWEALPRAQQVGFCERLAARAARDLAFLGLRPVSFGTRERATAFFSLGGRELVFAPGANATLGFDAASWSRASLPV